MAYTRKTKDVIVIQYRLHGESTWEDETEYDSKDWKQAQNDLKEYRASCGANYGDYRKITRRVKIEYIPVNMQNLYVGAIFCPLEDKNEICKVVEKDGYKYFLSNKDYNPQTYHLIKNQEVYQIR